MSTSTLRLHGISWSHSRGFTPLVATAQRFSELNSGVEISWTKRSLQAFADQPIASLAEKFDLLVIDHPWIGYAATNELLVPLDGLVPSFFLADQAKNSVGHSHHSYAYAGHQWALAIDAAAPVAAYRTDLLERAGVAAPKMWDDVIALGRQGLVACPSIPLDVYGNFLNLCVSTGAEIFPSDEEVVNASDGVASLERLRELASVVPARFFELNPIETLEVMSQSDSFTYCPFTYGYSNYARRGYARHEICFGDVVSVEPGRLGRTMLGGTGLAISSRCERPDLAARYIEFVASAATQKGLYFECGGQPGHREAWLDASCNRQSGSFFSSTLPTLDRAFVRPRYAGYLDFQERAGEPIHAFLREGGRASDVLDRLNRLYRENRRVARSLSVDGQAVLKTVAARETS